MGNRRNFCRGRSSPPPPPKKKKTHGEKGLHKEKIVSPHEYPFSFSRGVGKRLPLTIYAVLIVSKVLNVTAKCKFQHFEVITRNVTAKC